MKSEGMNKQPVRWWPSVGLVMLAAFALALIWAWPDVPRQQQILRTGGTLLSAAVLLFVWFLFFSRIAWRRRLTGAAFVFLGLAVFASAFRIRGVNGDLVPILELRWKAQRSFSSAAAPAANIGTNSFPTNLSSDFPQFYGPDRNAALDSPSLETNWISNPPKILWKQSIGAAWSGFAVKDGFAVTQEQRGEDEFVTCYELLTGRSLWTHSDTARYGTTIAGEGPRATPTIVDERVYTFGGTGILNCFNLRSGTLHWRKDTARENEAKIPDWGYASSPLIVDGKVIVNVGGKNGSLVAYDATKGDLLWAEGRGGAEYSSPLEAKILNERQILNFDGAGVSGHALDGNLLWNHPWPGRHPHVTAPVVVSSNQILVSSGYGTGCELITISRGAEDKWTATREWKSMALKSKFAPIFVKDNYIYGLDDGIFTCVELKTGQRQWKDGRYGHGQGLLVAGLILLTSEKGEVILIQPNPNELVEISRFQVFTDKTWNPPALAGEYLLMRNDKEAACLQLPVRKIPHRNVALSFAK
jgi:outer membrane protein assembly factor BamB